VKFDIIIWVKKGISNIGIIFFSLFFYLETKYKNDKTKMEIIADLHLNLYDAI